MMSQIRVILDRAQKACNGQKMRTEFLFLIATIVFAAPANAENSNWTKTPGGSVRLIIDNPVQRTPEVRGAIQINLDPGWKTYWREPGDAGVPPELELTESSNIKGYKLSFPAPHRFDDGNTHWAGYKKPIALPVTITLADSAKPARLKGHAFLGICETICIPVTAEFDISIDNTPSDPLTKTQVAKAFEQLPGEASASFGARNAARKDDRVRITVDLPSGDPEPDIFVAGDEGITFGMSKLKSREANSAVFAIPIVAGKDKKLVPLHYTLVQGEKAVSGTIDVQE
jgi:DsbC/DsbD-like thiol-disulfide interchange protein